MREPLRSDATGREWRCTPGTASTRETDHKAHYVVIRTRYEIEVDGGSVTGHMAVANDGRVHYHAVPNLSFPSADAY